MNRCTFGFHDWNRWVEIERGELISETVSFFFDEEDNDEEFVTGNYLIQERTCAMCGKIQQQSTEINL